MYIRTNSVLPGQALVEIQNVSKRFVLHQEQHRSFQELFINFFRSRSHRSLQRLFWPLNNVSFEVRQGESLGVIGPNGSGKSTLLKLIAGVLEPTEGDIVVRGRVSALLELGAGFHGDLTGRENIFLNGTMYGLTRREIESRIDDIIKFSELGEFIDMPIKHYSSGMYVRLGFAVAIHTNPDMLLVDEVLSVGDASFQAKCMSAIQDFRRNGGTMLFVSHDLGAVQSICDRAIWYEYGKIQNVGHPTDVVMAYLNHVAEKEEAAHQEQATKERLVIRDDQRWGTRQVEITGVDLCDRSGQPRSIFISGAPMEIRIHYKTSTRIENPIFGMAIHHQNGTHLTGPNTHFGGLDIPSIEGEGEVVYHVPFLPLLAGEYLVSVAVHNQADTEMFDYHDRSYRFHVHTGNLREPYGMVTLNGAWRYKGSDEEATDLPVRPSLVLEQGI
jgi:lipopolysaccharide transport system ATP-binding protein